MNNFIHLRTRSQYSILNSLCTVESLINNAKNTSSVSIGLADDANLSGVFEFSLACKKNQIKPIIGMNAFLATDHELSTHGKMPYLGLMAKNQNGYKNLIQILYNSQFKNELKSSGQHYVTIKDMAEFGSDLICITGGFNGPISMALLNNETTLANKIVDTLTNVFHNNLYIELTRHGRKNEKEIEDQLIEIAINKNLPLVATNDVHFMEKDEFFAYDAMTCIQDGRYINENDRWRLNAEYYLKSPAEMSELFSDIPEAIANTVEIAKRCSFLLTENKPMLPSFAEDENECLNISAKNGLELRLKNIAPELQDTYRARMEYEMGILKQMGFAGYFLIVSDFIKWAKSNNIPVGPGRGSGAGSIIAWCVDITNVDPIKYGLIFERFLNPERVSMPDFDIDFCQTRREEVIEYVKQKYGENRVASIMTFGTLSAKVVLKDVGRVMHLPYAKVDEICKLIPFNPSEPITLAKAIEMDPQLRIAIIEDEEMQQLVDVAMILEGANRHTSTHAAGVVIASKSLLELVPVHKDQNSNIPVVAMNMKNVEKIGLVKFDFLGLKTLSIIQEAVQLVEENSQQKIDIDDINLHDEETFKLLRSLNTKGIFQLDSAIPRETMHQIKVDCIEEIVAITSLNRPGPMSNIPSFIKRKNGQEEITYYHKSIAHTLKETYGIIVYQEQVMQIAQVLSGYSLGGADLLRRAMGKKVPAEMDQQRSIFVEGAKKNNVEPKLAEEIFETVAKFAGYGFNKSHAMAYSIISYQTAYLKAHFKLEFYVAILNADIHNTDKLSETINDIRANKIKITLPDINKSAGKFTINNVDQSILYGLGALKSVGLEASKTIAIIRKDGGPFLDIFDFAERCGKLANKKQTESMIKSGCFDSLHQNRKQLLDSIEIITKYASDGRKSPEESSQASLFDDLLFAPKKPSLIDTKEDFTSAEKRLMEFDAIGLYLASHPLDEYAEQIGKLNMTTADTLDNILPEKKSIDIIMAGVVVRVKQRFGKNNRFAFLHLLDLTGLFEVMVFKDEIITSHREKFEIGQLMVVKISGKKDLEAGTRMIVMDIAAPQDFFSGKVKFDLKPVRSKENDQYDSGFAPISFGGLEDIPIQEEQKIPEQKNMPIAAIYPYFTLYNKPYTIVQIASIGQIKAIDEIVSECQKDPKGITLAAYFEEIKIKQWSMINEQDAALIVKSTALLLHPN